MNPEYTTSNEVMPPTSNPILGNLPWLLFLILIVAVPLAFLASIALSSLYRRAVLGAMRSRIDTRITDTGAWDVSRLPLEPVQIPLNITVLDSTTIATHKSAAMERQGAATAPPCCL